MKLKGSIIHFLGDSITEGYGTTAPGKVFHQIIKRKYHLKDAYNYGVGGTRIARQVVPSKVDTICDFYFELRADIMAPNADAVVVFGGTNDFGHGDAPFGTLESEDRYTFCGAVNSLISKLSKSFPNAKIIFMTPIHRTGEEQPSSASSKTLKDYADAISAICEKRGVSVIDLFRINPLDPFDSSLLPDGLHPNDKGHKILAQTIAKELLKI